MCSLTPVLLCYNNLGISEDLCVEPSFPISSPWRYNLQPRKFFYNKTRQMLEPHIYEPLNVGWIRILVLHPGEFHDPINISLAIERLDDCKSRPYEAVSYAWGNPSLSKTIRCGRHDIGVTENLEELLRWLRQKDKRRQLWIDALCINQSDISERNSQVNLMRWIYSNAKKVIIWTGCHEWLARDVIDWFRSWQPERLQENYGKGTIPGHAAVTAFLERAWFHRAWTFQEACLAVDAEVVCGSLSFPWVYITNTALALETNNLAQNILGSAADSILALARFASTSIEAEKKQPELLPLLRLTRGLQATDPRDKVYALLGMLTDTRNPGMQPDYSENVTVANVYTKCAWLLITRERGLSILSSSLGPIQGRDLPSWVPDWRLPRRTAILRSFEWPSDDTPYYDINRGCPVSQPAPAIDSASLSVYGARLATVTSTHSARTFLSALSVALMHSDRISRWNAFSPTFRALFSSLGYTASSAYPQTGESALMAFFRTLFADRLPEPAAMRDFVAATLANLRSVPSCGIDASKPGDAPPENAREVVEERSRYSKNRALEIETGPPLPARWIEGAPMLEREGEQERDGDGGEGERAAATREEREMQAFLYVCDMALNILDYPLYYSRGGGSAVAIVPARQTPFVHSEARSVTDKIGSAILTFMEGRVLFKTEEGLIGIGPGYMEEGDEVWDLFGGHVPYLLRPRLPEDEARGDWDYSLVGECYVHGVMKGELWNDPGHLHGPWAPRGESLNFENIRMV